MGVECSKRWSEFEKECFCGKKLPFSTQADSQTNTTEPGQDLRGSQDNAQTCAKEVPRCKGNPDGGSCRADCSKCLITNPGTICDMDGNFRNMQPKAFDDVSMVINGRNDKCELTDRLVLTCDSSGYNATGSFYTHCNVAFGWSYAIDNKFEAVPKAHLHLQHGDALAAEVSALVINPAVDEFNVSANYKFARSTLGFTFSKRKFPDSFNLNFLQAYTRYFVLALDADVNLYNWQASHLKLLGKAHSDNFEVTGAILDFGEQALQLCCYKPLTKWLKVGAHVETKNFRRFVKGSVGYQMDLCMQKSGDSFTIRESLDSDLTLASVAEYKCCPVTLLLSVVYYVDRKVKLGFGFVFD